MTFWEKKYSRWEKRKIQGRNLAHFENFPLGVARRRSEKFQTYVYPASHRGPEAVQAIKVPFLASRVRRRKIGPDIDQTLRPAEILALRGSEGLWQPFLSKILNLNVAVEAKSTGQRLLVNTQGGNLDRSCPPPLKLGI
jgi:hypothetical protein